MNRDKQIEEMANVIQNTWLPVNCGNVTIGDRRISEEDAGRVAYDLYTAGYRRASEVAREIFEEIEDKIAENDDMFERCASRLVSSDYANGRSEVVGEILHFLAELKKKYTEEQSNND